VASEKSFMVTITYAVSFEGKGSHDVDAILNLSDEISETEEHLREYASFERIGTKIEVK
jgi:hypothetical protein